ncbi:MAG: M24 family metallopeptidase, partial [Oscillospiraceae bacterium]
GCVYQGLCADMTRTFFIGEATEDQRKMYNYVLRGTMMGEEKAVDGAYIPDVDKAARDIIDESGYGATFVTRLGHGIGYSIHEAPDMKQSNKMYLEPGMTFSIEPGIYRVNE